MNRFETLRKGYQEGLLQEAELAEFLELISKADSPLAGQIDALLQAGKSGQPAPGEKEIILRRIRERMQPFQPANAKIHFLRRYRWAVAALLLLTGTALVFLLRHHPSKELTGSGRPASPVYDAAPGKTGAILTLADGSAIQLDSAGQGVIATQGHTKVQLDNGQLSYQVEKSNGDVAWNTMTTPRGRQFQLVLPDGSKVWLNAGSSLTYPVAFTGPERKVSISGEAYFEIRKDKIPFKVDLLSAPGGYSRGQVEVLGTHFNVNAYEDEANSKTTLLEGSVRINVKSETANGKPLSPLTFDISRTLSPGQQAIIPLSAQSNQSSGIQVQATDVEAVVAWKNGLFNFHKADLPTVMRQQSRWYDVEVVYQGPVPGRLFGGEVERNLHLSQVIKILSKMGVHCTIEGRKLLVQAD